MKPPPPMLPALGCVTARANAVATAASIALPPFRRIAAPASDAIAEVRDHHARSSRRRAASGCCATTGAAKANSTAVATTTR